MQEQHMGRMREVEAAHQAALREVQVLVQVQVLKRC